MATLSVVAAATLAATMIGSGTAIMTMTQQVYAQPSNTGSNSASCTMGGTGNTQSCSIHQGMCQLAQQSGRDTTGIINNSECS